MIPLEKHWEHHFKSIVHKPVPFPLFINSVMYGKWHDLMTPVFLPPFSTICLLCLILLLYGKASKKREDMQGVHEGITARLSMFLYHPDLWCLISCMQPRLSQCPSLSCYSMCLLTCLYKLWLLPHLTRLCLPVIRSIWGWQHQHHAVYVLLSSRLCSVICTSFLLFCLSSLFPSLCRLFIRCVNNCLPTVVIAPPCQPDVWSKWQCAQFSLAYIVQFLASLVPIAKKRTRFFSADVFYLWD